MELVQSKRQKLSDEPGLTLNRVDVKVSLL
jgi:hypothetical protein